MNFNCLFHTQITVLILCSFLLRRQTTAVMKIGIKWPKKKKKKTNWYHHRWAKFAPRRNWEVVMRFGDGADWRCAVTVILIRFKKGGWKKTWGEESRRTRESTRSYDAMSHVHTSTKSQRSLHTPAFQYSWKLVGPCPHDTKKKAWNMDLFKINNIQLDTNRVHTGGKAWIRLQNSVQD